MTAVIGVLSAALVLALLGLGLALDKLETERETSARLATEKLGWQSVATARGNEAASLRLRLRAAESRGRP